MVIKEFVDKDLGHVSYIAYDEITKEAICIDPQRDISAYNIFITENQLDLKYIFNTHIHADFVSGHLELKKIYPNVENIFHKKVPVNFDFISVEENDIFYIGNIILKIIETPGHTLFCISILVNEDDVDKYIFIGDFLFIGDMGRPDLLGENKKDELIQKLYDSANKILKLDEHIIIFTSHIHGSFCGKNLKTQYFSTLGIEKKTNNALKLACRKNKFFDYFKKLIIKTPAFFNKISTININGPIFIEDLKNIEYINYKDLHYKYNYKTDYIIDFRHPNCFKSAYIKDSINVYEYSNYVLILGSLIDINFNLILIGSKYTNFENIIMKLRKIGFDNIKYILKEDINEINNLCSFTYRYNNLDETINLDTDIDITEISKLDLCKNYKFICKNGYKSIAVESFLYRLKEYKCK